MRIDRRKLRIRLSALVVLSVLSWPLFYSGVVGSYHRFLLIDNCAVGTATLTGESWGGHARYNYRYVVGGKEYTGTSQRDYSSELYRDAGVGATIPVYYSVNHPSVSSLFVPESAVIGLPFFVIVFILWVFFLITVINPESDWAMNLDGYDKTTQQFR